MERERKKENLFFKKIETHPRVTADLVAQATDRGC